MTKGSPSDLYRFSSQSPWMKFPANIGEAGAKYLSFIYQWERSQWAPAEVLQRLTLSQREQVLRAAFAHTPHYRRTLSEVNYDPDIQLSEDAWARVPVLSRQEIQKEGKQLTARAAPKSQQVTKSVHSSGSTGSPIEVKLPPIKGQLWSAATLFEHILHGRDFGKKAAAIRVRKERDIGPEGRQAPNWGAPFTTLFETGPATLFSTHQDPEIQAEWLIRENPAYLLAFPSTIEAMLPVLKAKGADLPGLEHFRTLSEQLPPTLREDIYSQFGKKIVDMYSAQEVGYIALQCPDFDHYHLFQEICFTEILRDDGTPCAPGEIGRVVVTDPFNLAFPLIRYDVGDYAEMGEPCDCGRGQPVINRIMGRVRNLVTLPDGSRHWPLTASRQFRSIGGISQFQLIQKTLHKVEAKFVCDRPLSNEEKSQLIKIIQDRLTYPFEITIKEVDTIPRAASGKFEEFKSEVTQQEAAAIRTPADQSA